MHVPEGQGRRPRNEAHDETNDNINVRAACTLAHVIVSKAVKENEATQQENIMTGLHFLSTGVNGPGGTQNSMKANIKVRAV